MRFLKKLVSKKGQLSMEMGILIAAVILVVTIVAYYYTTRTKSMMERSGKEANTTVESMGVKTMDIIDKINSTIDTIG